MRVLLVEAASGLLLVAILGISGAPASHASCASDSGPSGAPVVFMGSAEEERRGFTRFSVTEVWAGPDLAPEVWVQSGQKQAPWPFSFFLGVGSSADADFLLGDRYIVGASERFVTNVCRVKELASGSMTSVDRPEIVRTPVANGADGADPPIGPLGQGLWVVGVLATIGAAIALFRRRKAFATSPLRNRRSATKPRRNS